VVKRALTATDPESVPANVLAAADLALTSPTGPVYLGIPTDYLSAPVQVSNAASRSQAPARIPGEPELQEAVDLLRAARAPLICAGSGALKAGAGPAVACLAERLAAPVVMTYAAKELLPPGHPCTVPATLHSPEVGALWDDADLVIASEPTSTASRRRTGRCRTRPVSWSSTSMSETGRRTTPPHLALVGDAAVVTVLLCERIGGAPDLEPTRKRLERVRSALRDAIADDEPGTTRGSCKRRTWTWPRWRRTAISGSERVPGR
jgi:acetolactate synthase-1/2/3 large subunit